MKTNSIKETPLLDIMPQHKKMFNITTFKKANKNQSKI